MWQGTDAEVVVRDHVAMQQDEAFRAALADALGRHGLGRPHGRPQSVGGGCIHAAWRWRMDRGHELFVKHNTAACEPMFAAEAAGLEELARAGGPRVPTPLARGTTAGRAWIALEYVPLAEGGDEAAFGWALAQQHRVGAQAFGWHRDNHLGTTPQPNGWYEHWVDFWRERRLGHQLALAAADGAERLAERGHRLAQRLPDLLPVDVAPSLLHGDLWGGNHGFDPDGLGVIFDPAVYYGDREADLAMTELFGGFGPRFYEGYVDAWPLAPGYETRRTLYNLYHVLNHAHLFGGGYAAQAERMIEGLLAETG